MWVSFAVTFALRWFLVVKNYLVTNYLQKKTYDSSKSDPISFDLFLELFNFHFRIRSRRILWKRLKSTRITVNMKPTILWKVEDSRAFGWKDGMEMTYEKKKQDRI